MIMFATPEKISYFGFCIPFLEHLGVEPISCENDKAVTFMALQPHLLNSHGHVHGGALMSVLDFTLSAAGRSHDPMGFGVVTINMSTSFISPGNTDLTIRAICLHRGASICFCEGEIRNTQDKLVAKASASFKLIKANR